MVKRSRTHQKNWQNENGTDRFIRVGVMIGADIAAFQTQGTAQVIWLVVAIVALVSSFTGFSLFYRLVGISTQKKRSAAEQKRPK